MGIFFKVLATKHAIFKFYGSSLREAIKTVKLRVVAKMQGIYNFLQKFTKKKWSYLAIFQQKNANLLGVFLKQYKIGLFSKSISYYVLIFVTFFRDLDQLTLLV